MGRVAPVVHTLNTARNGSRIFQTCAIRRGFPDADHELADEEIAERFGPLLERFITALEVDEGLLVQLAEGCARVHEKGEAKRRRSEERRRKEGDRSIDPMLTWTAERPRMLSKSHASP